jgi:hypothetical protein
MTSLHAPFPADASDSVSLTVAEEPAVSWRASQHRITGDQQHDGRRNLCAVEFLALPGIQPGQLWVVEHASTEPHLPPLAHHLITSANVVIYDRALYAIVAAHVPRGGYAEPAPWPNGVIDGAVDRCIQFARDGWSVVRLADHGTPRNERIARLVERLISAGCLASMSVRLFANANGSVPQQTETELGKLGIVIDATTPEVVLAVAFAAVGTGAAPHLYAISCNGLAG